MREAAAAVADRARFVSIDHDRLARWVGELDPAELHAAQADRPVRAPVEPSPEHLEHTVALVLALDAVNFGSGWHPVVTKRPGCSGATTMAAALRDHAALTPLTASWLSSVDEAACHAVFGQPRDGPVDELMATFARALRELGTTVRDAHGGSFVAMVAAADGSAPALVELLVSQLAGFRDIAVHDGQRVPLLKRAQLAAADLARTFDGTGPGALRDLDELTIFADNLVPHVLRLDGVLRFDDELVTRIEREELLELGEPGEVEIRAVAIHAASLLTMHLRDRDHPISDADLDLVLWRRGSGPRYKARPRHRCRCIWY